MGTTIQDFRAAASTSPLAHAVARRLAVLILLPLLVLGGHDALAAEFCVDTVAELDAALTEAASPANAQITTTIRLRQGTYHVGGSRMTQLGQAYFHRLELLGGYNTGCSARNIDPDFTVLDADGATSFKFEPLGELLIEGIRFQNIANRNQVQIWSAADNLTVKVRNNAFVGVGVLVFAGPTPHGDLTSGLSMRFVNNRVHGFPATHSFPAVSMSGLSQIRIVGNTFADNLGEDAVFVCNSGSDVWFVDNIGWNNDGADIRVFVDCTSNSAVGEGRFKSNLLQSANGVPIGDSGGNFYGADPLFVSAAGGNYRLQNASPAVNSGVATVNMAELDLAGIPRVVGSSVDRGAYESSVDDTIPATLTVTTVNDSGPGSLRQAILDANANSDFSYINFNIPGSCPRVISLTSADLPAISNGVRIDGWTQPLSVSNTRSKGDNATRCIVLNGSSGRSTGLSFTGSSTEQLWVQGLAFSGFSPGSGNGAALRLSGGKGNIIRGNQFGATLSAAAGSLALAASDSNIVLTGTSTSTVGGESPAHRNVIADAINFGVRTTSLGPLFSNSNEIVDNLIGSHATEATSDGNGTGISIATSNNTVRENTIVNSVGNGITLGANGNRVQGNRIGTRDTICLGSFCLGGASSNGGNGIAIDSGVNDSLIESNVIRNNGQAGIFIASSSASGASLRNWLSGNSLYANGGAGTAFFLYDGADNDASTANQSMANRGLNYPELTRASGNPQQGYVQGKLRTTAGDYIIDIFSSAQPDSGQPRGEAEVFHKSVSLTVAAGPPGENSLANFLIPFSITAGVNLAGRVITLTATDAAGNTSELSAPVIYELQDAIFADSFEN